MLQWSISRRKKLFEPTLENGCLNNRKVQRGKANNPKLILWDDETSGRKLSQMDKRIKNGWWHDIRVTTRTWNCMCWQTGHVIYMVLCKPTAESDLLFSAWDSFTMSHIHTGGLMGRQQQVNTRVAEAGLWLVFLLICVWVILALQHICVFLLKYRDKKTPIFRIKVHHV